MTAISWMILALISETGLKLSPPSTSHLNCPSLLQLCVQGLSRLRLLDG